MQPLELLSVSDLDAIHQTTMKILHEIGIRFSHEEALNIFKKHGFKVENQLVFLEEKQIMDLIKNIMGCALPTLVQSGRPSVEILSCFWESRNRNSGFVR